MKNKHFIGESRTTSGTIFFSPAHRLFYFDWRIR
jgi:hypothetical protein